MGKNLHSTFRAHLLLQIHDVQAIVFIYRVTKRSSRIPGSEWKEIGIVAVAYSVNTLQHGCERTGILS